VVVIRSGVILAACCSGAAGLDRQRVLGALMIDVSVFTDSMINVSEPMLGCVVCRVVMRVAVCDSDPGNRETPQESEHTRCDTERYGDAHIAEGIYEALPPIGENLRSVTRLVTLHPRCKFGPTFLRRRFASGVPQLVPKQTKRVRDHDERASLMHDDGGTDTHEPADGDNNEDRDDSQG